MQVSGFLVGFSLGLVGMVGLRLAVRDCRYSLLGVRLAGFWQGGLGGLKFSTSAIFLLVVWGLVGWLVDLAFLVVNFWPRSTVFIRTNFPSSFVNSFHAVHFSVPKVNFFCFLGGAGWGGTVVGGMGDDFLLNF